MRSCAAPVAKQIDRSVFLIGIPQHFGHLLDLIHGKPVKGTRDFLQIPLGPGIWANLALTSAVFLRFAIVPMLAALHLSWKNS